MGWKEVYASKLTTMDEAVKNVKSGDVVVIAHAVGEPVTLVDKMVEYVSSNNLHDVEIKQLVAMGHGLYGQPGMEKYIMQYGRNSRRLARGKPSRVKER